MTPATLKREYLSLPRVPLSWPITAGAPEQWWLDAVNRQSSIDRAREQASRRGPRAPLYIVPDPSPPEDEEENPDDGTPKDESPEPERDFALADHGGTQSLSVPLPTSGEVTVALPSDIPTLKIRAYVSGGHISYVYEGVPLPLPNSAWWDLPRLLSARELTFTITSAPAGATLTLLVERR